MHMAIILVLLGWVKARRHETKLSADELSAQYGIQLPAFAYDFSEYVTSAVIERSLDSSDLHLTMFLVGHSVVFNDYPFETISTAENVLYNWGQASKKWDANKNRTATTKHSSLMCILKNNDPKHTQPYRVPAMWVPTGVAKDHKLHGSLEILRCRIKGTTTIYNALSKRLDAALSVDLIRTKGIGVGGKSGKHVGTNSGGGTHRKFNGRRLLSSQLVNSSTTSAFDHSQEVILSFSVPWRSRVVGYGLPFPRNSSRLDPWPESSKYIFGATRNRTASVAATGSRSALPKIHVCVAGLRPLHPVRSNAGLPALLEFVEHYVSLGVDHVFLGIMLSPRSPHWSKYRHVLRPFIDESRVLSLSSMALDGFDDASGFGGVHLQDAYANMLFNNQCLYFSKGMADYVILLRATEFILPNSLFKILSKDGGGGSDYRSASPLLSLVFRNLTLPLASSPSLGGTGRGDRITKEIPCFYKITGAFGIPDPPELFGFMGGPGDSTFVGDFFSKPGFQLIGPLAAPHWHSSVLPTRLAMAVTSRDAAVCSYRGGGTRGTGSPYLTLRANAVPIPETIAIVIVHGAMLKKDDYSKSLKNEDLALAAKSLFPSLRMRLTRRKYPNVAAVTAAATRGMNLHSALEEDKLKRGVPIASSAMKPPFWLLCNVNALQEVLSKAFSS